MNVTIHSIEYTSKHFAEMDDTGKPTMKISKVPEIHYTVSMKNGSFKGKLPTNNQDLKTYIDNLNTYVLEAIQQEINNVK